MTRPQPTEYASFYARYIDLVPEDDLLSAMRQQGAVTAEQILRFAGNPGVRYAPDKWSVKQVIGHMTDTERVFGQRALFFARNDTAELPPFEQDDWMAVSDFDACSLESLLAEFQAVRWSHELFLRHLTLPAWERRGTAGGNPFTVRALAYSMLGHERAHLQVLQERYR
ncbi:DinB family protein [Deinococcus hopiensis]|uniref:DinB superfamily protein n=1 Tax=Deinococcus hopiensis KR-140 TaxID=695939 RepID=A0A1W1UQG6_9DEIO|nr:DinB family protein [Deinococcus hopiensis]SMB82944.1 DinB superfamily protein [Deinococcus hopiensis KR-140]